jgi:hypothetical protein
MSAPESSNTAQYTRWPGLLSLSLGVLLGPVVALINQEAIYGVNMWACGRNLRGPMHIVPALCLIVVLGAAYASHLNWRMVGRGVEDERHDVATRTRFLALLGISVSLLSAILILAQWLAIFVFDPCMRA